MRKTKIWENNQFKSIRIIKIKILNISKIMRKQNLSASLIKYQSKLTVNRVVDIFLAAP